MVQDSNPDPARWLAEHGDAMYLFALMRLRDPEQAEDAVQETFLAAIKAFERFDGRARERTWLIGILKHKIIDIIRKKSRERPATELAGSDEADEVIQRMFDERGHGHEHYSEWNLDPQAALSQKEFREQFRHCLDDVPDRQAQAFILHEVEGMKGPEICKVMGITPTNLWAMLHRARMRLQKCLEVHWFGGQCPRD